jgi:hypothetical protein
MRNVHTVLVEKVKGRQHLEDLEGRIILKWIAGERVWTKFM